MKAGCTISFIGPVPEAALHSSRGVRRRRPTDADAARVPPGRQVVNDFPVLSAGPTPSVPLRAVDLHRQRVVNQSRSRTWNLRQGSRHLVVGSGDRVGADTARPLALFESGFAARWYVPRAGGDEAALSPSEGQTFCPYKGLCSYYDIPDARRAAWSYTDAWAKIRCVCGLVSFEPDKVEMHLDGARLRLEPGQNVISHGLDHELTPDEIASRRQA